MSRVMIESAFSSKLECLVQPVELCNESGRVIGRFTPKLDPAKFGPLEPQVSSEELRRRSLSNEKRYTTSEVLAHLEKL